MHDGEHSLAVWLAPQTPVQPPPLVRHVISSSSSSVFPRQRYLRSAQRLCCCHWPFGSPPRKRPLFAFPFVSPTIKLSPTMGKPFCTGVQAGSKASSLLPGRPQPACLPGRLRPCPHCKSRGGDHRFGRVLIVLVVCIMRPSYIAFASAQSVVSEI
jgi:hypothetical protein